MSRIDFTAGFVNGANDVSLIKALVAVEPEGICHVHSHKLHKLTYFGTLYKCAFGGTKELATQHYKQSKINSNCIHVVS